MTAVIKLLPLMQSYASGHCTWSLVSAGKHGYGNRSHRSQCARILTLDPSGHETGYVHAVLTLQQHLRHRTLRVWSAAHCSQAL